MSRSGWRRWGRRLVVAGASIIVIAWLGFEVLVRLTALPDDLSARAEMTPEIIDRHGNPLGVVTNEEGVRTFPVPLEAMADPLVMATLAAEDHRFRQHGGIDLRAVVRAAAQNLRQGRVVSGASTITQQLAKLGCGSAERDFGAKFREALVAVRLEREWDKDRIIACYLNRIDYGNRNRGVEAAARDYFGKPASGLTIQESVYLAGLPRAPSWLNPRRHPERAEERYCSVVARLERLGWLSSAELDQLQQAPELADIGAPEKPAPHFVSRLRSSPKPAGGVMETTLDLGLQLRVQGILRRHLNRLEREGARARHAAAVVLDHRDGSVRAWVGSPSWSGRAGQIDGVRLARSSGSTLKPFLYLNAIDQGVLTAASLLPDTPDAIRRVYPDYDPRNYDERHLGPVRVRQALGNSLNVPAVVALSRVGARQFSQFLTRSGIPMERSLEEVGAGLILGNAEVRLLDLATAYGAFDGDGIVIRPRTLKSDPVRRTAISSREASMIVADMMADGSARRHSFGVFSPLTFDSDHYVPCKTGTSSGFRDAWTVGLTGRHVVGVWVGNFTGEPMNEVASASGPAPAWREIVELLLEEDGSLPAPTESGMEIEQIEICPLSGLRPVADGPESVREWFLSGTSPQADASSFFLPDGGVRLPREFGVWVRSSHNHLGAEVQSGRTLEIVHPMEGSVFVMDAQVPKDRQRIELVATGWSSRDRLEWRVDGRSISGEDRYFWRLEPGSHRIEVRDGARSSSVRITVEDP